MLRTAALAFAICVAMMLGGCPFPESSGPIGAATSGSGSGTGTDTGGSSGSSTGTTVGTGPGSSVSDGSSPGSGGTGDTVGTPGSGGTGADPGSGGTGAVASVGTVDGFGSVIVNGVRYDDTSTTLTLEDSSALAIGMVVRVTGTVTGSGTTGVAQTIEAGAEAIGPISSLSTGSAQFTVMGTTVQAGSTTVWGNVAGLASLSAGMNVKVSGLWANGVLMATRVEAPGAISVYQITGAVQALDTVARTFRVGDLTVSYALSAFQGITSGDLANGLLVRVRGSSAPVGSVFAPTRIQGWLNGSRTNGGNIHLRGIVYSFNSLADFQLLGASVKADGNGVQFSADSSNVSNGAEVEVKGRWSSGTLVAQKVTILSGPNGTRPRYTLNGTVGNFSSAASFKVKGSAVDAASASPVFVNGTVSDLGNGKKVEVTGYDISNDVLKASTVTFTVTP